MHLTTEEFQDLVAQDVRHRLDDDRGQWLRSPGVIDDWYDALVALIRSVDLQFAGKKAEKEQKRIELADFPREWDEYIVSVASWKVKTIRFKQAIEERIAECRKLRRTAVPKDLVSLDGVNLLIHAIEEHKHRLDEDEEMLDDSADEELWDVLNEDSVGALKRLIGAA